MSKKSAFIKALKSVLRSFDHCYCRVLNDQVGFRNSTTNRNVARLPELVGHNFRHSNSQHFKLSYPGQSPQRSRSLGIWANNFWVFKHGNRISVVTKNLIFCCTPCNIRMVSYWTLSFSRDNFFQDILQVIRKQSSLLEMEEVVGGEVCPLCPILQQNHSPKIHFKMRRPCCKNGKNVMTLHYLVLTCKRGGPNCT